MADVDERWEIRNGHCGRGGEEGRFSRWTRRSPSFSLALTTSSAGLC